MNLKQVTAAVKFPYSPLLEKIDLRFSQAISADVG
jgi:hypothetical protein